MFVFKVHIKAFWGTLTDDEIKKKGFAQRGFNIFFPFSSRLRSLFIFWRASVIHVCMVVYEIFLKAHFCGGQNVELYRKVSSDYIRHVYTVLKNNRNSDGVKINSRCIDTQSAFPNATA